MRASRISNSKLTGVLTALALWQLLAMFINRPLLPSPITVLPLFCRSMVHDLGIHFIASAGRVLAAIGLAAATAVPLGLCMGQFSRLDRLLNPLVSLVYPVPKIVFLPVIYLLMGISNFTKIFLIALIIFFQILVVVRDEAANLHPELLLSVRSLGAGHRALLRFVYLPASLTAVLTGIRVSTGTAIAVLFIVEQSLTRYGLGYYIVVETYQVMRYPQMYAGIMAMGLLGLFLYTGIAWIEKRLTPHRFLNGDHR